MTQITTKPVKKEKFIEQKEKVKEREIRFKKKNSLSIRKKIIEFIRNFLRLFKFFTIPRINKEAFYRNENKPVPKNVPYFNIQRLLK